MEQQQAKLAKDKEYELAVQVLSTPFYTKKHSIGITAQEEADYRTAKSILWNTYLEWAKANGLYEQVTPEQQLTEIGLDNIVKEVNILRTELGLKAIRVV